MTPQPLSRIWGISIVLFVVMMMGTIFVITAVSLDQPITRHSRFLGRTAIESATMRLRAKARLYTAGMTDIAQYPAVASGLARGDSETARVYVETVTFLGERPKLLLWDKQQGVVTHTGATLSEDINLADILNGRSPSFTRITPLPKGGAAIHLAIPIQANRTIVGALYGVFEMPSLGPGIWDRFAKLGTGQVIVETDDREIFNYGVSVPGTAQTVFLDDLGVTIRCTTRLGPLQSGRDKYRIYLKIATGVVGLLGLLLAYTVGWTWVVKPIRNLKMDTTTIASGHPSRSPSKHYHVREIQELAESIQAMARQISSHREDLEAKVRERTQALRVELKVRGKAEQEKTHLQAQLRQSQRLGALGRLAGGIAHDFNNLLTTIIGSVSLLRRDYEAKGKLLKTLDIIEQASRSGADVTRQLLIFSRKQVVESRLFDLGDLIDNRQKMIRQLLGDHIELNLHLRGDNYWVKFDPGQMEQIIVNLAVNARDAMPNGGKMTIATSRATIAKRDVKPTGDLLPGEYTVLEIRDTGVGIDEYTQQHLFEPFFTTKPKDKGTGLGLAMVYGAVTQHKGTIHISSQTGQGSCFRIYLPSVDGDVASIFYESRQKRIPTGSETLLCVEDDPVIRQLNEEILSPLGYDLVLAADAEEAVSLAQNHPHRFQLLLTDILLPQMHEGDIARKLRKICPDIKILFTSGCTDDAFIEQCRQYDAAFFLAKPYDADDLALKIREVLDTDKTKRDKPY